MNRNFHLSPRYFISLNTFSIELNVYIENQSNLRAEALIHTQLHPSYIGATQATSVDRQTIYGHLSNKMNCSELVVDLKVVLDAVGPMSRDSDSRIASTRNVQVCMSAVYRWPPADSHPHRRPCSLPSDLARPSVCPSGPGARYVCRLEFQTESSIEWY